MPRAESIKRGAEIRSRRGFVVAHLLAGIIGLIVSAAYVVVFGQPTGVELLAFVWLLLPLGIAAYGAQARALTGPQMASLASLFGLVTFAAANTGGLSSFFIVWFVLAPVEASLSGRRPLILVGALAAVLGLAALFLLDRFALTPASVLPGEMAALLAFAVPLAAIAYAAAASLSVESAYRRATQAAEEGEWKYRMLADNAVDMITRHGSDGRFQFVSPAVRALLGYDPIELNGVSPGRFVHPRDRATVDGAITEASYRGHTAAAEVRMRRKDGTYVWVDLRCRPASDGAAPHDVVAVTRDISERKRHEAELVAARDGADAANRSKSRFLANMSHELRTPLNAIIGFADMMRSETFGAHAHPKYAEYSRLIVDSGHHLLELISDILDMSKIEAGKYDLARTRIDLDALAEDCIETLGPAAMKAGVRLRRDIAPDLGPLDADKRALKQILLNLLSNAIKFTPPQGAIVLGAAREGKFARIEVRDTGVGIPPEALARLGKPFEQVDGEYARSQPGTGLGLAVVKALAVLHGGRMEIESALGDGTIVSVFLPLAEAKPRAALKLVAGGMH